MSNGSSWAATIWRLGLGLSYGLHWAYGYG
jgi:hypothetical protein